MVKGPESFYSRISNIETALRHCLFIKTAVTTTETLRSSSSNHFKIINIK